MIRSAQSVGKATPAPGVNHRAKCGDTYLGCGEGALLDYSSLGNPDSSSTVKPVKPTADSAVHDCLA